jgi:predicted ATPase
MTNQKSPRRPVPRIESIRIKNYRALCDLETKPLSPLTALLGPNGSGKSTGLSTSSPSSPNASNRYHHPPNRPHLHSTNSRASFPSRNPATSE